MIKVHIVQSDVDKMLAEVRRKVKGIESLRTPYNREQMAKAIFTIAGKDFMKATDVLAAHGGTRVKHLYEWNKVGKPTGRLFVITRDGVKGGSLKIGTKFKDSKVPVPIPAELKEPGPTGRFVNRKHIFKRKAEVMDKNSPVQSYAGWAQALALPSGGYGPIFIRYPRVVTIQHPGGRQAKNGMQLTLTAWFKNPNNITASLAKSGYFKSLEFQLAKELRQRGAGATRASSVIKAVSDKYSKGLVAL